MIHKFLINHVILIYVTLQSIDAWQSTERQAWGDYRIKKHIPEIDSIIYEHIPEIGSCIAGMSIFLKLTHEIDSL